MNDYSQVFQPDLSQFMQAPQQQAQGQFAPQANSYPALPNAYGLGQVQQQPQDPYAQQKQQQQNQMMADSSRGFSPWSISGESNAR